MVTLQAELEEATLTSAQMEQKARESEQHAESLQSQLTDCINVMNETCSEEMGQLHSEVNTLSALKVVGAMFNAMLFLPSHITYLFHEMGPTMSKADG